MTQEEHRQAAKRLLVYYLETIARKAGMRWDRDMTIEVCDIVDHVVAASKAEVTNG